MPVTKFSTDINLFFRKLKRLPFVLLGNKIKARQEKFYNLRIALRQARVPMSYEMYISNALFYSVVSGIIGALIGLLIAYIVVSVVGLPPALTRLTFSESTAWLLKYRNISISIFIMFLLTALFGGITYGLFLLFPAFQAGERKQSIDKNLPYAVTFMYALSRGGMNVIDILRSLAKSENTYGETSREVDVVLRDMDYFGSDLKSALYNLCEITPSAKLKDLMYNLLTVIDSGGNIAVYFKDKSEQYLNSAKVEQKGFLETLGLIAESYVTAFVAGPLFIIILGVMMAVMSNGSNIMVYAIIYAVIPIGSLMFVVMVSIITPGSAGEAPLLPTESYVGEIVVPETEEKNKFLNFIRSRDNIKFKKILQDPLKPFRENPTYTLLITVPIALIYLTITIIGGLRSVNIVDYVDDPVVYSFYIIAIPLAVFHELKKGWEGKIQSQFPDFLKKLASTNETGMTLRDSIKLMTQSDMGMGKEIKKIYNDIDWALTINEALRRFANRVRTHVVARSITLVTKANESSGDIGEVLTVAARDAAAEQELKNERMVSMFIYIIIIYMSFIIFIGIIYVISSTFLEQMVKAGERVTTSGSRAIAMSLTREGLADYNRIFFHGALIQGVCSGLISGVMGEGSVLSGLKHSVIMVTLGYLLFKLFVL